MAKVATILNNWNGYSTYALPGGSYDSAKIGLGPLMFRQNEGGNLGNYIGPMKVGVARPFESASAQSPSMVHAIKWADDKYWVFLGDLSTAGTTRRIMMYEYTPSTSTFDVTGHITATMPSGGTNTLRGFRMTYTKHTSGTVDVVGTTVVGTGTTWGADGVCLGNRIGFGSTDPTQITTWYTISGKAGDTGITLSSSAPTITGASYVIEDLRAVIVTTNGTAASGGLFLVKGLSVNDFVVSGTTITAATTVDNIKACYWLKDASTNLNTVACGLIMEPETTKTSQMVWVVDGTASTLLYKHNIRAALSLTSGADTANSFQYKTAAQAVTGTAGQVNNGRYAVVAHGPGSGIGCGYICTTTRVYRTKELSTITTGANWQEDAMTEVPPGSVNTYAATAALSSVEYSGTIDRFIVKTTNATSFRDYVTQYQTTGNPFERIFTSNDQQLDSSTADSDSVPHLNNQILSTIWVEDGIAFSQKQAGSNLAVLYAWPIGADWEYTSISNNRIILPAINTPNADTLDRVFFNDVDAVGSLSGFNLAKSTEPYRFYYRTSGISDNSGAWTLLDRSGNLSGISPSTQIQFMLEFRTIGDWCIPARVLACGLVYNDLTTDSHYQPSIGKSSIASKIFAWRFSTAFGSTVPTLRIRLYNGITGGSLLDDTTTASAYGTWQKSTDGTTWGSYNTTDKGNDTTYIRYTPTSLADNITVRALLTLG